MKRVAPSLGFRADEAPLEPMAAASSTRRDDGRLTAARSRGGAALPPSVAQIECRPILQNILATDRPRV